MKETPYMTYSRALLIAVALVAAFSLGAVLGSTGMFRNYTGFNECVLREMRGQAREMRQYAVGLCRERVSKPQPLDFSRYAEPVPQ